MTRIVPGYWRCTHCGNVEASEREVNCWKCGCGEMRYERLERSRIAHFIASLWHSWTCNCLVTAVIAPGVRICGRCGFLYSRPSSPPSTET